MDRTNFDQQAFDNKAEHWNSTRELPWNRLRYELTYDLIQRHLPEKVTSILEVGCGNGYESSLWNEEVDHITLSDYSGKMLDSAKSLFQGLRPVETMDFVQADAKDLTKKLNRKYDVILFHNVIEYVSDAEEALSEMKKLLAPGGMISIRYLNRYSNPFIPAMYENDLHTTHKYLQYPEIETSFGTTIRTFTMDQIQSILSNVGIGVEKYYGVMALTGYMTDNEKKYEPQFYNQLKQIELEMADRFPYYHIARFGLFLGK